MAYFKNILCVFKNFVVTLQPEDRGYQKDTMKVFNTIVELQNELFMLRKVGKAIGLVPTMGALHAGHASLVKRCTEENDVTVVSVFVNPTQFNDKSDLATYPRTLDADCELLQKIEDAADGNSPSTVLVFAPTAEEMYPVPDERRFEYPPVSTVMEGAHRPGHFNGVCQVVSRLFYIVRPRKAYFGEKDYQQIAVVKAMVKALGLGVEIVECPIVREASGLAMSSRNSRLTDAERITAACIYKVLKSSVGYAKTHTVTDTHDRVVSEINAVEGLEVEYFSIVDADTLTDISSWSEPASGAVGCITVYCGEGRVRLIDHIKYA